MQYSHCIPATFLSRPNRFVACVKVASGSEICVHVKNTGRCRELLVPGAAVYLSESNNSNRKTSYDLVSVRKGERLINIDSAAPNAAVKEWLLEKKLFPDLTFLKPETKFSASRFDFYAEHGAQRTFLEIKGVTLEENGIVRFPDAPTIRGVKHIQELIHAAAMGYETYLLFVIQMGQVSVFQPNDATDPQFGAALRLAVQAGVNLLAYDCTVMPDSMKIRTSIPIRL